MRSLWNTISPPIVNIIYLYSPSGGGCRFDSVIQSCHVTGGGQRALQFLTVSTCVIYVFISPY